MFGRASGAAALRLAEKFFRIRNVWFDACFFLASGVQPVDLREALRTEKTAAAKADCASAALCCHLRDSLHPGGWGFGAY